MMGVGGTNNGLPKHSAIVDGPLSDRIEVVFADGSRPANTPAHVMACGAWIMDDGCFIFCKRGQGIPNPEGMEVGPDAYRPTAWIPPDAAWPLLSICRQIDEIRGIVCDADKEMAARVTALDDPCATEAHS